MYSIPVIFFWFSFLVFVLLVAFVYYNALTVRGPIRNSKSTDMYYVMFALLGVFGAFTGDFVSYGDEVARMATQQRYASHFEDIYIWFIKVTEGNYLAFRVFMSVMSYALLYWLLRLFNKSDLRVLFLYCALEYVFAIEGRQQINIYMFFLGVFLMIGRKKYIYGVLLVIVSYFFHKGGVFCSFLLPFLLFKLNARNLVIAMVLFPVIVIVENNILDWALGIRLRDMRGLTYLDAEDFSRTAAMKVVYYGRIAIQYVLALWALWKYVKFKDKVPKVYGYVASMLFGSIYLSSCLLLLDIEQMTLFDRSLRVSWMPIIILGAEFLKPRLGKNKLVLACCFSYLALSAAYTYLVSIYQSFYYD